MLPSSFFAQDAVTLAPALLGCELVHTIGQQTTAGIIVETEAYRQDDEASHSFGGQTQRNGVMFGAAGYVYIYFTYGMHYCFNVVAGQEGVAEAVLIRALQPTQGIALMQRRRNNTDPLNLCSGPAKLVQAMGLGPEQNGANLTTSHLHIQRRSTAPRVAAGPRIGIRRATTTPWRFWVAANPYVTKHKFNNG
jgi:DNA-3-methyladenine glycosylase